MTHPNPHRHVVPTVVLTRSKLVPLTTARPVPTVVPYNNVIRPMQAKTLGTKSHSPPRRTINHRPSPQASNFHQRVTTAKALQVNVVKGVRGDWGNLQHALKDKGVIDSGCSRHMTRNVSYLSDFKEINDGYVAFGGNPKGGKITGKGKIRTGKFDGKADEGFLVGYYNTDDDATFEVKEPEFEVEKPESKVHVSLSSSAKTKKQDEKTKREVFRNKKDERGIVVRNKARLITQGHTQEEGIDYDEVFAPVARIEAIRLFLAYASFMGFMMYQMDVKSVFLYETIKKEVYVCQTTGFEDLDYPDKVYKVVKALYGLHQALRAYYETLANYLLENGFQRGKIDQTLFIKKQKGDILLVQKQDEIFISQDKYVAEILRKFGLTDGKSASTPIDTEKPLLKDPDGEDVDIHTY
nr:putative ribonuclease H-like domain-containing protein [Tanacetum cinerariifolium]